MTGAYVKDFSSIMTFVGSSASNQMTKTQPDMNFSDMMDKASQVKPESNIESTPSKKDVKPADFEKKDRISESKVPSKEVKTENKELTEENAYDEEIEKAAQEAIKEVAEELDVTEEDVVKALEEMGLNPMAILDTENLNGLIITLSEEDPIELVTNENLFNTVQDLTTAIDAIVGDLADDMDIEFSKVVEMIENAETQSSVTEEMQMSVEANSEPDIVKGIVTEEPKAEDETLVKSSFKSNDSEITVETDSKGNLVKVQNVTENKVDDKQSDSKDNESEDAESDLSKDHSFKAMEALSNNVSKDTNSISDVPNVQETFLSNETREIMDQIMDHIKVNAKPDMDELQMQLHPESLGTVKVNLTNKAGEITAEFKVQNETVKAAVEAQLNELRETLRESGTKVTEVSVSVDTQGFDSNLWKGREDRPDEGTNKQRRMRRIDLNSLDALFEDEASEEEILAAKVMEINGNTVDYQA